MIVRSFFVALSLLLMGCQQKEAPTKDNRGDKQVKVTLTTSVGDIDIILYEDKAPITVRNFLRYVDDGFYVDTQFHRVVKGFVIQGGGFTEDLMLKPVHEPIRNEADNGLSNKRGTIAMARTSDVHSATSQFYINLNDNGFLDHKNSTSSDFGYTVFGEVVSGMDIVDQIGSMSVNTKKTMTHVPEKPILIKKITRS